MRFLIYAGLIIFTAILDTSVFVNVNIAGIRPDAMLCLVVSLALLQGNVVGMFCGLFGGLLLDIIAFDILGYYAFIYTLVGFFIGLMHGRPSRHFAMSIIIGTVTYVLVQVIQMLVFYFMELDFSFFTVLWRYVIPSAAFCAVWMVLTHFLLKKLCVLPIMHPYSARDTF